jgi:hypothetical protein
VQYSEYNESEYSEYSEYSESEYSESNETFFRWTLSIQVKHSEDDYNEYST